MAMTNCKECGTNVSSKATACPKCGAPVKRKSHPLAIGCFTLMLAFVAIIAVIIVVIAALSPAAPNRSPSSSAPSTTSSQKPSSEAESRPTKPQAAPRSTRMKAATSRGESFLSDGSATTGIMRTSPDSSLSVIASDEEAHDFWTQHGSDVRARNRYIQAGRLMLCDPGVAVRLVDVGFLTHTVIIEEGLHEGRSGIIAAEHYHPGQ